MTILDQDIVHQIQNEFDDLLNFVLLDSRSSQAYEVERDIFHRLLQIGYMLMKAWFQMRCDQYGHSPLVGMMARKPHFWRRKHARFSPSLANSSLTDPISIGAIKAGCPLWMNYWAWETTSIRICCGRWQGRAAGSGRIRWGTEDTEKRSGGQTEQLNVRACTGIKPQPKPCWPCGLWLRMMIGMSIMRFDKLKAGE